MTDYPDWSAEIERECQYMVDLLSTPIFMAPDIFGRIETPNERYREIAACGQRIAKLAAMTDEQWEAACQQTPPPTKTAKAIQFVWGDSVY